MAPIHVAMLVHEFPKRSEAFLVDKFVGLVRAGVEVQLIAEREQREDFGLFPELTADPSLRARIHLWPARERPVALIWRMLGALALACWRSPRALLALWRDLAHQGLSERIGRLAYGAKLLALSPEIAHFEFGTLAARRPELLVGRGFRCIVSYRGWDVNYDALDAPEEIAHVFACADAFHFLGRDLHARAVRRGLSADAHVALIPPAVDLSRFDRSQRSQRGGSSDGKVRIVAVGRLHWKKGYEFALRALRLAREAGVEFEYRIVGDGPFRPAVEACVRDEALEDHVTLLGPLDRAGVARELAEADLMLHAAVSEGFCNAVLEAQAMGVPVVCSDADGLSENVADGVTGIVVPRRDAVGMCAAIVSLAGDPERRRAMSQRGPERVRDAFAPEDQIAAFIRLYEATSETAGLATDRPESPTIPPRRSG